MGYIFLVGPSAVILLMGLLLLRSNQRSYRFFAIALPTALFGVELFSWMYLAREISDGIALSVQGLSLLGVSALLLLVYFIARLRAKT
jgi:hypothetical protein